MTEIDELRAELAKVTGERDRLKVNFNLESNQFHDNQWRQLTEMAAELAAAREALAVADKALEEADEQCQGCAAMTPIRSARALIDFHKPKESA